MSLKGLRRNKIQHNIQQDAKTMFRTFVLCDESAEYEISVNMNYNQISMANQNTIRLEELK